MLNVISGILDAGVPPVTNSYESIATVTVGAGGSSTITFSSIPSTYKHLQIRYMAADSRSGTPWSYLYMTFNGDTGSNYSEHVIYGDGGGSAGAGGGSSVKMPMICGDASHYGAGIADILDYTDTNKYKTVRSLSGNDENGSGFINFASGNWRNTAAVTSITLTPLTANIREYSSFALYGIKG